MTTEASDDGIKIYAAYRDYVEHESNLLNHRMTWLLTINGFLFTASALVAQKAIDLLKDRQSLLTILAMLFLLLISNIGANVSRATFSAIQGAKRAVEALEKQFENAFIIENAFGYSYISIQGHKLPLITAGGGQEKSSLGSEASRLIPQTFIRAWQFANIAFVLLIIYSIADSFYENRTTLLKLLGAGSS